MGSKGNSADEQAYHRALPLLARKPLTASELGTALCESGFELEQVEEAVRRLSDEGYLDDRKLALHYILARTERLGHGPGRLLKELEHRGVEPEVARAALNEAVSEHGLEENRLLRRQVRRRVDRCGGKLDLRSFRRVYNALLRAGFEPCAIRSELDRHRAFSEQSDNGTEHDLA